MNETELELMDIQDAYGLELFVEMCAQDERTELLL
jgi:hypothetical protein